MRLLCRAALTLALVANAIACRDTCSAGDTLANPRLDAARPPIETETSFDVLFDRVASGPAAALPSDYFGQGGARSVGEGSADGGVLVQLVEPGRLRFELDRPLAAGVEVVVELPDRRGFIECTHPGAPDVYRVDFSLTRGLAAGYRLEVTQNVDLGPLI